ncbi:glycosyl hydrolase family 28-related protein [Pseudobutyrivibrio sp. ACV-2]|uniref:glycosyl hydrolase family 28-related protein n=1 Tax=Pseudobutyrivibrio sp. ACV-2 TaxID=1520801 RepID=UPI00147EDD3B|nr:glycosyl hydrolase family 28-related protein [Pseudobutyrivibrio sp. ACV-2]
MFYVEMPDNGQIVCIGDGLINSSDEKSGEMAVERSVVTAPDNSAFVGNSYHVVWNNIRHGENGIEVYGKAESGPKPERKVTASVRDFGAVGDGITDDTDAIQQAIYSCPNGELYFPTGTYVISNVIRIPSNIHIAGDSSNSIIIAKEGTKRGATMLKIYNASNVKLENICISGNSSVNYENMDTIGGIHLLDLSTSNNITISNCYFIDNIYAAIRDVNTNNVIVENCSFLNVDCGFITLGKYNTHDIIVRNCVFDGHRASEPVSLFADGSHDNVLIENNHMSNKTSGCGVLVAGLQPNHNIRIINNVIDSCATGIKVVNSTNVQVLNNSISNLTNGAGIRMYDCTDAVLGDNICYNIQQDGLEVKDCTNLTITNLTTTNCGQGNDNFVNVRFRGEKNSNVSFSDSSIEYNNTNSKVGLIFSCETDIDMNNIDYDNASIWLTKKTSNMSLSAPSTVKVRDQGQANEILKY